MAQQIPALRESTAPSQPATQTDGETTDSSGNTAAEEANTPESSAEAEQIQRSDPDTCDDCGGHLVRRGVDRLCSDCGLVAESMPIKRRRRRELDRNFGDATRCGGNGRTVTRHDRGMATKIGYAADLRNLSNKKRNQIYRLRRHHSQSRFGANDYRRMSAFTEIKRITSALGLPKHITEKACVLFREAHEADLLQGRTHEWFSSASIYAACRCESIVRTADEIAEYARCDPSDIHLAYGHLNKTFGLGASPVSPQEYIPRYASLLDLSYETRKKAETIAVRTHDLGEDTGRSPSGIAGACLLLAADETGEKLTQKATSDVADVAPATVRKSKKHLRERDLDTEDTERSGGTTSVAEQTFKTEDSSGMIATRAGPLDEMESSSTAHEERQNSETPGHMAPIPENFDLGVDRSAEETVDSSDDDASTADTDSTAQNDETTDADLRADDLPDAPHPTPGPARLRQRLTDSDPSASGDRVSGASQQQVHTGGEYTMEAQPDMIDESTTNKTTQQSLGALEESPVEDSSDGKSDTQSDGGAEHRQFTLDAEDDTDTLIDLRTKQRSRDGKPDTFRYWLRLPYSLEGDTDHFEAGEYVQITFANGHGGGVGAAATGETLPRDTLDDVAGIYLRKAPSETDGSQVASSRKIRDDSYGQPVTLPPRIIEEQAGLGLDPETYHSEDAALLFEPIVRDDGVLLVPAGYDDGSAFELPEPPADADLIHEAGSEEAAIKTGASTSQNHAPPDPEAPSNVLEGEYAGLDVESLPKNVLPLVQRVRSGGTGKDSSYGYSVYLRKALSGMETQFKAGDHATVDFDSGRENPLMSDADRSRYDDDFDPALMLGRIAEDDDPSMAPDARKLQDRKSGVEIVIPPKFVTGTGSLGIDGDDYDSTENPLLFEVLLGPHVIMLDPIGYQDGTPYPQPKSKSSTDSASQKAKSSTDSESQHEQVLDIDLGDSEYIDGTAISAEITREVAKEANFSLETLTEALVAVEQNTDREELKEQGVFDTDYPPLYPPAVGDHELADAAPVVDFIETEVWEETIIPPIADMFDDTDLGTLQHLLLVIHARQAKQDISARDSYEHRRFNKEVSALVTLNPDV